MNFFNKAFQGRNKQNLQPETQSRTFH